MGKHLQGHTGLPLGCFGEKNVRLLGVGLHRQNRQKLSCQIGVIRVLARLPHGQKLLSAVSPVAQTGIGQPHGVLVDASQHRKVVVLSMLDIDNDGHFQACELLPTGRKSLRPEAKLGQSLGHVFKAGAAIAFVHRFEQSLLRHVLAPETVEHRRQRCRTTRIVQVLFDNLFIAKRLPAFNWHRAMSGIGGQSSAFGVAASGLCMGH